VLLPRMPHARDQRLDGKRQAAIGSIAEVIDRRRVGSGRANREMGSGSVSQWQEPIVVIEDAGYAT